MLQWTLGYMCLFQLWFPQDVCTVVGLWNHMVVLGFPVAQLVKNLPTMQETWVWSLGWEDPLEEGMETLSRILGWRIPMNRGARRATVLGSQRVRHDWTAKRSTQHNMVVLFLVFWGLSILFSRVPVINLHPHQQCKKVLFSLEPL